MKRTLLALALVVAAPFAAANELDNEATTANNNERLAIAKALPQTTIVRVSKTDPTKVEILHLENKLAKGTKITNARFEQVAVNTEIKGINFSASNELDATSSTSSWRWGWGGGAAVGVGYGRWGAGWGGGAVAVRGPRGGVAVAGGRRTWVSNGYYPSWGVNSGAVVVSGGGWNSGCGNNCWNQGCGNNCWNNGCGNNCWNSGCGGGGCIQPFYQVNQVRFQPQFAWGWEDNNWDYNCFEQNWW